MFSRFFQFLKRLDIYLLGLSFLLAFLGLLMIYSMTYATAAGDSSLLVRQAVFLTGGIMLLFLFTSLNYRYLYKVSVLAYVFSLCLLAGVLVFGLNVKGSLRWFDLGFFRFQPVEFTKIALIIFLSAFFQKRINRINNFSTVFLSVIFAAVPVIFTLAQPDLGSALVLLAIWFGILIAAGVKKQYLLWLLIFLLAVSSLAWSLALKDYQKDRIFSFLSPTADPQGRGYNALQSVIAVGSGGLFGRGLARGVVSQLRFLPERQTDFIFASLAEELGFLGVLFLLLVILIWFFRIIKVINSSTDNFSLLLSVGIFCYFFVQITINIGMNIGVLPITGVPLPLISYGGSSMAASLVCIGILESIVLHSSRLRFEN